MLRAVAGRRRGHRRGHAARRRGAPDQELRAGCRTSAPGSRPRTCSPRRSRCRRRAIPIRPRARAFWQRLLEKARAIPGVTTAGLDHERAVQRQRQLRLVLDRRLHAGPERSRAARPAGNRRRRLLPRDADSADRGTAVQRRRHRGEPAGRRRRSVPGEPVLRRPQPARPGDPARRPDQLRRSRSSASSARSTASTSRSR